jgi:hypothetical protein
VVTQIGCHRWCFALQRLMLTAEIIPLDEQGLHGRVVTEALGMAVGEPGKPPHAHRLNRSIWLVLIAALRLASACRLRRSIPSIPL